MLLDGQAEELLTMLLDDYVEELKAENERFRTALQNIEKFGHGVGCGRGYTCATMAAEALQIKVL